MLDYSPRFVKSVWSIMILCRLFHVADGVEFLRARGESTILEALANGQSPLAPVSVS
jgi:hypothetical protein